MKMVEDLQITRQYSFLKHREKLVTGLKNILAVVDL